LIRNKLRLIEIKRDLEITEAIKYQISNPKFFTPLSNNSELAMLV